MSRRVLILAGFLPPLGGVGMLRTLRLVRHLSSIDWDAEVVTVAGSPTRTAMMTRWALSQTAYSCIGCPHLTRPLSRSAWGTRSPRSPLA